MDNKYEVKPVFDTLLLLQNIILRGAYYNYEETAHFWGFQVQYDCQNNLKLINSGRDQASLGHG